MNASHFQQLHRKRHVFRGQKKNSLGIKCVFYLQRLSETFLKLGRIQQDKITNVLKDSIRSARYFCLILTKLDFSGQIIKDIHSIKFHEKPSSGCRIVPCGQTYRQKHTTQLTVTCRNFANLPEN
jgi:hypothetical protein